MMNSAVSMKTPKDKYLNDPQYRQLVDMLEAFIRQCDFSPSEIRQAAMLACIHYELSQPPPPFYVSDSETLTALQTLEKFRWLHMNEPIRPAPKEGR